MATGRRGHRAGWKRGSACRLLGPVARSSRSGETSASDGHTFAGPGPGDTPSSLQSTRAGSGAVPGPLPSLGRPHRLNTASRPAGAAPAPSRRRPGGRRRPPARGRPDGPPPPTRLPVAERRQEYRESSPPPPHSKTVKGGRGGSAHVRSAARSLRRPDPAPRAPARPGPGPGPRPRPAPARWAPQVSARPRPPGRLAWAAPPTLTPRASRGSGPCVPSPRARPRRARTPAPRPAPGVGAASLPPPSPEKVAILVQCLWAPPHPKASAIRGPSRARPGPHPPQVTGGWRGQPPSVRPQVSLIRAPGPGPGSPAERRWPRSRRQRRQRSARGTPTPLPASVPPLRPCWALREGGSPFSSWCASHRPWVEGGSLPPRPALSPAPNSESSTQAGGTLERWLSAAPTPPASGVIAGRG